jgi:hypothetical protein
MFGQFDIPSIVRVVNFSQRPGNVSKTVIHSLTNDQIGDFKDMPNKWGLSPFIGSVFGLLMRLTWTETCSWALRIIPGISSG